MRIRNLLFSSQIDAKLGLLHKFKKFQLEREISIMCCRASQSAKRLLTCLVLYIRLYQKMESIMFLFAQVMYKKQPASNLEWVTQCEYSLRYWTLTWNSRSYRNLLKWLDFAHKNLLNFGKFLTPWGETYPHGEIFPSLDFTSDLSLYFCKFATFNKKKLLSLSVASEKVVLHPSLHYW